jgi:hypothetical protein
MSRIDSFEHTLTVIIIKTRKEEGKNTAQEGGIEGRKQKGWEVKRKKGRMT